MSLYYCDNNYLDDCAEPDTGWIREESIPNINETCDFLEGILEALYETGDAFRLEGMVEELCHLYDIAIPNKELKIQGKKDNALMESYLNYQKTLIERSNSEVA